MNKAWHLRQDGKAFPVKVHIYCMQDEDLSSEAEAASFIINTNSQDKDLAMYVLDAWMALLIEQEVNYDAGEDDIDNAITEAINSTGYKFQYPLSSTTLLNIHKKSNNYSDINSLYDFIDEVRDNIEDIQSNIMKSLNQQFCRVRFGGQYNSVSGNNEIWFRISSINYNWVNTIYKFTADNLRTYNISQISICRDSESDGGFDNSQEYFYKAKDGTLYKHMPIDEYLQEEHEHNPVFEAININEGPHCTMRKCMQSGDTYNKVVKLLEGSGVLVDRRIWNYFMRRERTLYCVPEDKSDYNFRCEL